VIRALGSSKTEQNYDDA